VTLTPIAFSVNGGHAAGSLVLPKAEGPFPVVVYASGQGDVQARPEKAGETCASVGSRGTGWR
jgi:hypothetical protein